MFNSIQRKSIRRKVKVNWSSDTLFTKDGSRSLRHLKRILGLKIPKVSYTVRWYLHPQGKFIVSGGFTHNAMSVAKQSSADVAVCFLPREWAGMRIARKAWVKGGRND